MLGELLGRLDAQQRHEGEGEQDGAQAEEAVAQLAVDLLADVEQALLEKGRKGEQHAGSGTASAAWNSGSASTSLPSDASMRSIVRFTATPGSQA